MEWEGPFVKGQTRIIWVCLIFYEIFQKCRSGTFHRKEMEKSMEQFGREWEQQPEYRQLRLRGDWRVHDRVKYDAENERLITALKNSYRTSVSI
mgnify:CR=1 FL=1